MITLKELLAIAAGGILLAMTGAASLQAMPVTTEATICQHNLEAIFKAAQIFSQQNHDAFPLLVDRQKHPWRFWYWEVVAHSDETAIFYCPASDKVRAAGIFAAGPRDPLERLPFQEHWQSYGMNYFLSSKDTLQQKTHRVADVATPAYTVYFGDSQTPYLRATPCWPTDVALRHQGQDQYVFLDGHVERHDEKSLGLFKAMANWSQDKPRWQNWK